MPGRLSQQFWTEVQSWYNSRAGAQRKGKGSNLAPIVQKQQQWEKRGSRYLRNHTTALAATRRGTHVGVDPRLYAELQRLSARVVPVLAKAMDDRIGALALAAFKAWPVASGLSKALLTLEYKVQDGGSKFAAILASRAPYTVFIKDQPHIKLIDRPAARIPDLIGRDVLNELAKPTNGGGA